jgi:hypothetical protein
VETRQELAVAEARPVVEVEPAASVVVALPASSAAEAHLAPAVPEALAEAEVTALQQELAAVAMQPEAAAVEQQGPALAGTSQETAVEIPDDDVPPPGWDQWGSPSVPAPDPQAGALVRRQDGHMVAMGSRLGTGASPSRACPLARAARRWARGMIKSTLTRHPLFVDAQEDEDQERPSGRWMTAP